MTRFTLLLAFLTACGADGAGVLAQTPEGVARAWFAAAEAGDTARLAGFVDPRCADAPVGQGAPARILGKDVDIRDLELVTTQASDGEANVAYNFRGELYRARTTREKTVAGRDVVVTTEASNLDMGEKSGNLSLIRMDGSWKVTCTFAAIRAQ